MLSLGVSFLRAANTVRCGVIACVSRGSAASLTSYVRIHGQADFLPLSRDWTLDFLKVGNLVFYAQSTITVLWGRADYLALD